MILVSMTLMTVGTALVSRVDGPWQFIALYGVVAAVGYTGCGILPVSIHERNLEKSTAARPHERHKGATVRNNGAQRKLAAGKPVSVVASTYSAPGLVELLGHQGTG